MRTFFPRSHRHLIAISTAWTLLLLLFAPPLNATQCLDELEGSLARIIDAEASFSDVKATIAWDATTDLPATVTLEVWDGSGVLVTSTVVSPTAGEMTVEWIPGAL